MIIDEDKHPDLSSSNGPYGELFGWSNGYRIMALRGAYQDKYMLTIGTLTKMYPYIEEIEDGNKLFSVFYEANENEYETIQEKDELFVDALLFGFDIGTIYQNKLRLLELEKAIKVEKGKFNIGINYYNFQDTLQAGAEYNDYMLNDYISLGAEAFLNVYKKEHGTDLAYILPKASIYFFKDKGIRGENSIRDFFVSLNLGASYSKDIFYDGLFGYSCDVSFENIYLLINYVRITLGVSNNYHKTLYRMPIKDETLFLSAFTIFL